VCAGGAESFLVIVHLRTDFPYFYVCAGDTDTPHGTGWATLPVELAEDILGMLTLPELARVCTTSKAFQATFGRQMAAKQKARCDLAIARCGREGIACIVALVDRYFKGETMHPVLVEPAPGQNVINHCWISSDWTLHAEPRDRKSAASNARSYKSGDITVAIMLEFPWPGCATLSLQADHGQPIELRISPRHYPGAKIRITPGGDKEVTKVALVQALLCGVPDSPNPKADSPSAHPNVLIPQSDLALPFHGRSVQIEIDVHGQVSCDDLTAEGLRVQVAPLLPLTSDYTFEDRAVDLYMSRRQGGSGARREVRLLAVRHKAI
jgi:hypothetical protein